MTGDVGSNQAADPVATSLEPARPWSCVDHTTPTVVPEPADTPAALLRRAADLIDADGWCQGVWMNSAGGRCLDGALGAVGFPDDWDVYREAREALTTPELVEGVVGPIGWNDTPGRTQEEVTALLRSTADKLEGAETDG